MKGFTVIESLVTIAMIAILSVALIPSFQSARAQLALDRSASLLAQEVRGVMEKAMSAQDYTLCTHVNYKYGYGIYLTTGTTGSYILFADCNGDGSYNNPSLDRTIKQVSFELGVVINGLSRNNVYVIFEPPDPFISIVSGDDSANIILQASGKQRTININKVGLIDID